MKQNLVIPDGDKISSQKLAVMENQTITMNYENNYVNNDNDFET